MSGIGITTGDVYLGDLNRELDRFVTRTGADFFREAEIVGRNLAVSLAHGTQPYGRDRGDAAQGLWAVNRDVRRVFGSPADVHEKLPTDRQGPFWQAVESKDWARAERLTEGTAYAGIPFAETVDPALHQARRTGRRKEVRGKIPSAIIRDPRRINTYVRKVQKRVGLAKSAWAHAAVEAGGHARGVPAWAGVRRHKRKLGGADKQRRGLRPGVTMEAFARHTRETLAFAEENKAVQIAAQRLVKRLQIALRKSTRRYNRAA